MSVEVSGKKNLKQAVGERKQYDYDVGPRIAATGAALSSATATLTDPDGNEAALATAVGTSGTVATATVLGSEIDETGAWKLDIVATLDNDETPTCRFHITVEF